MFDILNSKIFLINKIPNYCSFVKPLLLHFLELCNKTMKLGRDDLVFCYPDGRALDLSTVTHAFARVMLLCWESR